MLVTFHSKAWSSITLFGDVAVISPAYVRERTAQSDVKAGNLGFLPRQEFLLSYRLPGSGLRICSFPGIAFCDWHPIA